MKNLFLITFITILAFTACKKNNERTTSLPYDPPGATITTDKEITQQHKRTFYFSSDGLFISNEFEGARLNDVYRIEPFVYEAVIEPENAPVNNSAWYAFMTWSDYPQTITLILKYKDGTHRYIPKLSYDKENWFPLEDERIKIDASKQTAQLELNIGYDTLWVAAQELITSSVYDKWEDELAAKPFVEKREIGKSAGGRAINELLISENEAANNYVIFTGRLHPPEVTGFFALKSFVETIADSSEIAKEFRSKFNTIVIPLVNPDGVDNGHWRHNIHGVDLNRDWVKFNQPEPRAVRDEVNRIVKQNGKPHFFIDFHSTQEDVFYTMTLSSMLDDNLTESEKEKVKEGYELVNKWLSNLQKRFPDYHVNIVDTLSKKTSPTSDRWFQKTYHIPALTYEVGDETDRQLIKKIANGAAIWLMKLLNEKGTLNRTLAKSGL